MNCIMCRVIHVTKFLNLNIVYTSKNTFFLVLLVITNLWSKSDANEETDYYPHNINMEFQSIIGEKEPGDKKLTQIKPLVKLNYSGAVQLFKNTALLIDENIDAMTTATAYSPLRQLNQPTTSATKLGLQFTHYGCIQLKGFADFYPWSSMIKFPVGQEITSYLNDARIIPKHREGAQLYLDLPIGALNFKSNVLYSNLTYDYYRLGYDEKDLYDTDLWFDFLLDYSFKPIKRHNIFTIVAGGLVKHDLNEYNGYNYSEGYAGIQTRLKVYRKKFLIRASLLGRYTFSTLMDLKGYADDQGLLGRLRVIFMPKKFFYIKTDVSSEIAPVTTKEWYIKQKYAVSIAKVWRKNFARFETGSWMSFGSLFPRMCFFGDGTIPLGQKLKVLPSVRTYFHGQTFGEWQKVDSLTSGVDTTTITLKIENGKKIKIDKKGNKFLYEKTFTDFAYYRTDLELLFRYPLLSERNNFLKNMNLYWGVRYQLFNPSPNVDSFISPHVNTLSIQLGLTNHFL